MSNSKPLQPRLRALWRKSENDLVVDWDPGCSRASARYLMSLLSSAVLAELDSRGYDLATIRFQIRKKETFPASGLLPESVPFLQCPCCEKVTFHEDAEGLVHNNDTGACLCRTWMFYDGKSCPTIKWDKDKACRDPKCRTLRPVSEA